MADVEKLFEKGSEAFNKKNWDYAIEIFKSIVTMDPNHVKARQALKMTTIQKGSFPGKFSSTLKGGAVLGQIGVNKGADKRIQLAQDYLCTDPLNISVRLALGAALKDGNYIDGAITEYEHVIQMDANNLSALKGLAELHAKKGDHKKAIEYCTKVQAIDPTDREVTSQLKNLLAENAMKEGKMSDAKSFRDMLKDQGGASRMEQDKHLVKSGAEMDEEIGRMQAQVAADPTNPAQAKTLKKISDLQRKKHDLDAAIATLERAAQLDRADATIRMKIGDIRIEKLEGKAGAAKAAANNDTNDPGFRAAYSELIKYKIEEFARRAKDHPTDMQLRYEYGRALLTGGQVDLAVAEFQQTVKDPKRKLESMNFLGQCFFRKKIFDLAATQYQKALEVCPTSEWEMQLRYNLMDALKALGKIEDAKAECKKIMNIDISYKDVSKKLEELNALG
ncbi:MAG: tetratricopeptide repeat protein [Planctomycetes bacterium]|nr:tetratricopeptide repeat protein [Planctomycetota bacterium]